MSEYDEDNYRFEPEAKNDLEDSFLWYEKQKEGLGRDFAIEVFDKAREISKVSRDKKDSSVQKAYLKRFPFSLYYVFKEKWISIIAVWHNKRNPETLKKRK
ncbi:MAG: type II toxin-antitoxin system RelE/ParE family toxin [Leptospiraceae bacterium]|nr:type II toxin-antitoxin system RelE/ParE family toxin [Leptospiraceae bacterium]MCP5501071.1 type II toxin-antitoxin system RelE/ParE family toxin [Leptospiraceae bacterium]